MCFDKKVPDQTIASIRLGQLAGKVCGKVCELIKNLSDVPKS